jgi:hypothetical protein
VLREAFRVLRGDGVLGVIEPNRANPMILGHAILVRAERAALSSDESRLRRDLASAGFHIVSVDRAQPLPLARLLHPRLGLHTIARRPRVARLLDAADRVMARLMPRASWMYLVARARKRRA